MDALNAEDLLSLAASAEMLGVRFPTQTEGMFADGSYVRRMLVWAVLTLLESSIASDLPAQYRMFAQAVHPTDTVMTLNYDVIVETAMWQVERGVSYALPATAVTSEVSYVDTDGGFSVQAAWLRELVQV